MHAADLLRGRLDGRRLVTLLNDITARPAFALIRFGEEETVRLLGGTAGQLASLTDVPVSPEPVRQPPGFDQLICVPFAQIHERGFRAVDDATPLTSIDIDVQGEVNLRALLAELPDEEVTAVGPAGFDIPDEEYADLVGRVIADEIGRGEGANLVIARNFRATISNWGLAKALSVLRRLLERERGAYWTYLVFTGDRYLIGASPERHLSVIGGEVRMNPISGTFRLGPEAATGDLKPRLLRFLDDAKEIYELFMVVDEELKMMCAICGEGGQIFGPYLKPMSHLIHTEYVLAGRTSLDVREVLRSSLFAATVTGSPVENACRLIAEYEPDGRGYYGALLALVGRDPAGHPTLDAPIVLRTAEVSRSGELRVTAGATLVRNSDPRGEVAETAAKAAGILSAFGLAPAAATAAADVSKLLIDTEVVDRLHRRNTRLSRFWFEEQSNRCPDPRLADRHVVILDGEDDFVTMLQHLLRVLGMSTQTIRHHEYAAGAFDGADLVIVGPGPGDPRDGGDVKIKAVRAAIDDLLDARRPFLAVCLGHQVLCASLGLPLAVKDIVFQGTQASIELRGRRENVGFYNTFVARVDESTRLPAGVSVDSDEATGDIHYLAGPHYRGIQFHAESILTENGFDLLRELVTDLI